MTREKKIVMVYNVEIRVEGYGDKPYFKEVADREMKDLFLDTTSAHVTKGAASVKIKKSKIITCEELGRYDEFQFKNKVKPDYSNAGGLNVYSPEDADENGDCWVTWYNDEGTDIDECDDEGNTLPFEDE